MRIIHKILAGLMLQTVLMVGVVGLGIVEAQCVVYDCGYDTIDDATGEQIHVDQWCDGCNDITGSCPPNTYQAPNGTCQQNGTAPPPLSGGGACWNGTVNCQSGATISLGQPINTFCSVNVFSDPMCSPPGSAQRETVCRDQ